MSESDILAGLIALPGQSRDERSPLALDPNYAQIDERDPEALVAAVQALAAQLPYTSTSGASGTWAPMFALAPEQLAKLSASGQVPAHLALLAAFADMYQLPRALQNRITTSHLEFHQREVLGITPRPAVPDRAHVLLKLKRGVTRLALTSSDLFTAGKDDAGVDRRYAPTGPAVINTGRVESLRSIYVNPASGRLHHAPIANSSDGLGTALDELDRSWPGFAGPSLPEAEIGFAIASPLLRLAGGKRIIRVQLELQGAAALASAKLGSAFAASLTGAQGWIDVAAPTLDYSKSTLSIEIQLGTDVGAIVDYAAAVHGGSYASQAPLLRMLMRAQPGLGYTELAPITVSRASVEVEVEGLAATTLDNDYGKLDPNKPFMAFGPEPRTGARLAIGCPEALAKPLRQLSMSFTWKDPPKSFFTLYKAYGPAGLLQDGNEYFTVKLGFADDGGWHIDASGKTLFDADDARATHTIAFNKHLVAPKRTPLGELLPALQGSGSVWGIDEAVRLALASPSSASRSPAPARDDAITLELERGFLHAEYRKFQLGIALGDPKPSPLPDAPYVPIVQTLSLAYRAQSDQVGISTTAERDFAHPHLQFFHHDCFGQRREHALLRSKLAHVDQDRVPLLPEHPDAGELLIGVADLRAGDSVSLLMQVLEGSADPLLPRAKLSWSVLVDNYWLPLRPGVGVLDATNSLVRSGIVKLFTPSYTTTASTLLPTDLVWLRAGVDAVDAVCRLLSVDANAVELRFEDQGNSPTHLQQVLPAKSIKKLVTPRAELASVVQPYASFGGAPTEDAKAMRTRVAERLRHKQRAITAWDYERIVLEAFPQLHRVKCIPHTNLDQSFAPGHLTLVVIPDLRNDNARDPLRPRVDADTISRIQALVQRHAGMGVQIWVRNPEYQRVHLSFAVRLRAGFEFNQTRDDLEQALIRALSRWAFEPTQALHFGASVYRSSLLHFVERLEYVDYLRNFVMTVQAPESMGDQQVAVTHEARPSSPAAVLVSAAHHSIVEVPA